MIAVIDLPRQIDPELAADIEKEAAFVSPFLRALRVTGGRAAVELEIADRARDAEVKGKVERFLDAMLKRVHRFEPKVFLRRERRDDGPLATGCERGAAAARLAVRLWPGPRRPVGPGAGAGRADRRQGGRALRPAFRGRAAQLPGLRRCRHPASLRLFRFAPERDQLRRPHGRGFRRDRGVPPGQQLRRGRLDAGRRPCPSAGPVPQSRRLLPLLSDARGPADRRRGRRLQLEGPGVPLRIAQPRRARPALGVQCARAGVRRQRRRTSPTAAGGSCR